MPDFKYRGVLKDGKIIRGILPAQTRHEVVQKLKESKIQPVVVKRKKINNNVKAKQHDIDRQNKAKERSIRFLKKSSALSDKEGNKGMSFKELLKSDIHIFNPIKVHDIITFMNNLYILKKAKFNNIQALKSLYEGTENPVFRDIIEDILIGVEQGQRMHSVMSNYPKVFDPMVVNFIRVGEESGSLDVALLYARDYVESSTTLNKKIKAAVIPRVVGIVAIIIMLFVALIFGVPMLQDIYDMFDSDEEIPVATQVALDCANWIIDKKFWIIGIVLIAIIIFQVWKHTPKGRYNWDKFKMRFPVIGRVVTNMIVSNFLQAMLLNLRNGMRLKEALEISKNVTTNYYFLSTVEVAKNRALIGESWITPFQDRQIFSPMVTEMISIGMQTELTEMMSKVNEYITTEVEESVTAFTRWLPEVTYAFLGIFIIIFVIVVMVPVMNVYMGSFITY